VNLESAASLSQRRTAIGWPWKCYLVTAYEARQ